MSIGDIFDKGPHVPLELQSFHRFRLCQKLPQRGERYSRISIFMRQHLIWPRNMIVAIISADLAIGRVTKVNLATGSGFQIVCAVCFARFIVLEYMTSN